MATALRATSPAVWAALLAEPCIAGHVRVSPVGGGHRSRNSRGYVFGGAALGMVHSSSTRVGRENGLEVRRGRLVKQIQICRNRPREARSCTKIGATYTMFCAGAEVEVRNWTAAPVVAPGLAHSRSRPRVWAHLGQVWPDIDTALAADSTDVAAMSTALPNTLA